MYLRTLLSFAVLLGLSCAHKSSKQVGEDEKEKLLLTKLEEMEQSTPPPETDWCGTLNWEYQVTDTIKFNGPYGNIAVQKHLLRINKEDQRRITIRNRALVEVLKKTPSIPDCKIKGHGYDPSGWLISAYHQEEKVLPRNLLIPALKSMMEEEGHLSNLRSKKPDEQAQAQRKYEFISRAFQLSRSDLHRIGLTSREIRQIWQQKSSRVHL